MSSTTKNTRAPASTSMLISSLKRTTAMGTTYFPMMSRSTSLEVGKLARRYLDSWEYASPLFNVFKRRPTP
jgi:hypothetical protein